MGNITVKLIGENTNMQLIIKVRAWAKDAAGRPPVMWDWNVYRKDIAEWIINCPPDVILMQDTGLKDKNGKNLYEGDIYKTNNHTRQVVWDYNLLEELSRHEKDIEIIGNIYQNPELIA